MYSLDDGTTATLFMSDFGDMQLLSTFAVLNLDEVYLDPKNTGGCCLAMNDKMVVCGWIVENFEFNISRKENIDAQL